MRGGGGRMGGGRAGSGRGLGATGGGRGGAGGFGPGPIGSGPGGPRGNWNRGRPHIGFGGFGWGGGWRRRRGGFFMGPSFSGILIMLFLVAVVGVCSQQQGGRGAAQITASTVRRTALPQGSAIDAGPMFTDHLGWIGNQTRLATGMRNFFQRTGVRPHLYLVGEIYGTITPSDSQLQSFAHARYSELFNDEAHILLLFFENIHGQYGMWLAVGNQARTVIDQEAENILMDYVQRHYYTNLSTEDMFSRAFDDASRRIMTVTRSPWIPVLIVAGVIVVLFVLFTWWKRAKEQKNKEAEQTERILGQSLETFESSSNSDDATSRLAEKYDDEKRQ